MVTQNVPSSPSLSRSGSARRPNTLSLGSGKAPSGSNSPKSPGNTSPTKSTKSPGSPATSIKGRAAPRRSGSLGKGSQVTRPVGPNLSTEARSLTRPCGCGKAGHGTARGNAGHKDGHANGHHAHDDAQHSQHASPLPERKERTKKTVKSPTKAKSPPAQIMPPPPAQITPPPPAQTTPPPPPPQIEEPVPTSENDSNINGHSNHDDDSSSNKQESTQVSYQDLKNRYISTLVWVPRMMTEKCF